MDSPPIEAMVAFRSSPAVRRLNVGVVSLGVASRIGELVGVRTICLLRVDFSEVGVLLCDSVR